LCDSQKVLDKRCCAYQRRKEATEKATAHLENMVKRILSTGVSAKYLLMDSWFTMPATVVVLAQHLKVIGMVKKSSRIHYTFNGQSLDLKAIYRRIRKHRGRAKILASADVILKQKVAAKLMFVRDRRKKDWLAMLSTDTDLSDEEIVRIYGKRWDIEIYHDNCIYKRDSYLVSLDTSFSLCSSVFFLFQDMDMFGPAPGLFSHCSKPIDFSSIGTDDQYDFSRDLGAAVF
jgi:hypothetical protein